MSSIEEDVEVLKKCYCMTTTHAIDKGNIELKKAIENVLNALEQKDNEIQELKEELSDWKFTAKYVEENYISKDKVRHKIEEMNNMIDEIFKGKLQKYIVGEIISYKTILKELLEEV